MLLAAKHARPFLSSRVRPARERVRTMATGDDAPSRQFTAGGRLYLGMAATGDAFHMQVPQVIHLVRHGQGFHNLAAERADTPEAKEAAYCMDAYFDAHLTELGWRQALGLRKHLEEQHVRKGVELVVASPLTRALETATGAFGGAPLTDVAPEQGEVLMRGYAAEPDKTADCPGYSAAGAPEFVVHEWVREETGLHPCDGRRPIRVQKERWPGVREWIVASDEDTWYKEHERETREQCMARMQTFCEWLASRPERRIAVVAHAGALAGLMSHLVLRGVNGVQAHAEHAEDMTAPWANCEMRTIVLPQVGGHGSDKDRWHYRPKDLTGLGF
ncbi:unnamed protein product [Pedinophyceae sp. YPF-701]|nr:unnamed protein product [Pedinophyceae sp. YPF-701]